jgi:hypothetical protein
MLEHTRTLFTGQSDEPCLGVDRLAPTNSEADPQRFADSGADPLLPAGSGRCCVSLVTRGLSSRPPPRQRLAQEPHWQRREHAHSGPRCPE